MDIGIIGAGTIARDHALAAKSLGHRVVAGCTRTEDSPRWAAFREIQPDAVYVSDPNDMLNNDSLDALVVCLSWNEIPNWLPAILGSSKPVLIEKPIALSSDTVRSALAFAGAAEKNKMVGFNRRFYMPVKRLKARLSEGGLKAAQVTISENVNRLVERYGPSIVQHLLAYSSCHILDIAMHLFGKLDVSHICAYDEPGYDITFKSYNGLLTTSAGIPVGLSINADDPVGVGVRCMFDDHTSWHLSPVEVLNVYRGYDIQEPQADINIRRYTPKVEERVIVDTNFKPGFLEQMAVFLSGNFEHAARPSESMDLLMLIEAIKDKAVSGETKS